MEGDVAHQPLLGSRKLEGLPFMWYKNIAGRFFGLVTKHACDGRTDGRTDRSTDGQNYDSQDRVSIAASRGKNGSDDVHINEVRPTLRRCRIVLRWLTIRWVYTVLVCSQPVRLTQPPPLSGTGNEYRPTTYTVFTRGDRRGDRSRDRSCDDRTV